MVSEKTEKIFMFSLLVGTPVFVLLYSFFVLNIDPIILGKILEKVSGKTLFEYGTPSIGTFVLGGSIAALLSMLNVKKEKYTGSYFVNNFWRIPVMLFTLSLALSFIKLLVYEKSNVSLFPQIDSLGMLALFCFVFGAFSVVIWAFLSRRKLDNEN